MSDFLSFSFFTFALLLFFATFVAKLSEMKNFYYSTAIAIIFFLTAIVPGASAQNYSRYTNLPAMHIKTFDGKGITSKTVEKYATIYYVDEDDNVTTYDSVSIRGRGNSTWNMSKKPYRIKFLTKQKFLGKGKANAKKWTLMANAGDKTLIRNAVTSAMGEFLGLDFNPAYKFIDLYINGTYYGNYQVSDQVEVRKHRVDVEEQDFPVTDESDITGGYLLEVDGFSDGNCFTTSRYSVPIRIHYPDEDEIDFTQNNYIKQYMRDFESVLSGSKFTDPVEGYRSWVDSVSLVNWFLATEVSANIDGYYSTYFYKDKQDSLLYWGPLWDYDIAYGNDTRLGDTSRRLMTDVGYGQTKNWINRMWDDPWFGNLVNRRYAEVLEEGLVDHLMNTIDSLTLLLDESQKRNYSKWGIGTKMYHERVLYSSYKQYITDLKSFINTHTAYLQTAFAQKKPAEPTPPFHTSDYYYRIINSGTAKAIDIVGQSTSASANVCSWDNLSYRMSEQWQIEAVGDYFMIINRNSGMALNDPTPGTSTATTNTGTQLNVAKPNENDGRQLWSIVPQGNAGCYNLTNKYTQHTANLNGGSTLNGASIISYNTDSRNYTSANRLWYLIADDPIDASIASIDAELEEYALALRPDTKMLHFGSETPELLTFMVSIHSLSGRLVGQFRANEQFCTEALPSDTYIISWSAGGKRRSVKVQL